MPKNVFLGSQGTIITCLTTRVCFLGCFEVESSFRQLSLAVYMHMSAVLGARPRMRPWILSRLSG
jgi:hypothetical protein